ncbi:hypothetical protein [Fluviispira multicolorata]|uniref:Uncharacterized protein n=1 Tax=Fluviispira multicolorata TaxID=2654512 RepID=A0A833N339_9BACT|nr:hypothetical protein [Fluviispira multicolorata]KAB8029195.1 hypothetical protein GCL57_11705 [Fluviispira multicolorata]
MVNFSFKLKNGDLIDLTEYLIHLDLRENDTIIACGTIIENIGNEFSDIDVYIITDEYRTPKNINISNFYRTISRSKEVLDQSSNEEILLIHLPVEKSGMKIDIEFKTYSDINKLSESLNEFYNYAFQNYILLTKEMSERNMSFIHRIHNGVCILNEIKLSEIKYNLDKQKFNYYLYRVYASDYADLLDIIGAWRKEEYERCFDLARENLIKQMLGYVSLIGNTDYKRKWLLTRIEQYKIKDEIKSKFKKLFMLTDYGNTKDYIVETLNCVDDIYKESALFFSEVSNPIFPSGDKVIDWLNKKLTPLSKPYQICEIEYRKKAYLMQNFIPTKEMLIRELS